MGRTTYKLQPFLSASLLKGYINFRRLKNNLLELYTPRYKKDLDPAYEKIFKSYEKLCNRKYQGYIAKDTLKSAIRRSIFYEVISHAENKFVFRERTKHEIENMQKKKKEKIDSPASSGYSSGECSPLISQPVSPIPYSGESEDFLEPMESEIQAANSININMEEIRDSKFTDEEYGMVVQDLISGRVLVHDAKKYLCDAAQSVDDTTGSSERSQGLEQVEFNKLNEHVCGAGQAIEDIRSSPDKSQDSSVVPLKIFNVVHKDLKPDGSIILTLVPQDN